MATSMLTREVKALLLQLSSVFIVAWIQLNEKKHNRVCKGPMKMRSSGQKATRGILHFS